MDSRYLPVDLSIIISTYNRREHLLELLDKIPRGIEVIVADDGTVPDLSRDLPDWVKFYSHDHNGNRVSTCRNRGAGLATKPKLLFIDDDTEPHGLCYAAHSLALEMYDLSLGLLPREKWQPFTDDRLLFYMREDQVAWNWTWTGSLAVRAEVFWELNGFDELTFNGTNEEPASGFEDVDFGRRAWLMGKRLHLNRLAMSWHPAPHTSASPSPAVLRNQERYDLKWGKAA
jgi:GT2 family glycosyltransferase